jgi:hypothetical protein
VRCAIKSASLIRVLIPYLNVLNVMKNPIKNMYTPSPGVYHTFEIHTHTAMIRMLERQPLGCKGEASHKPAMGLLCVHMAAVPQIPPQRLWVVAVRLGLVALSLALPKRDDSGPSGHHCPPDGTVRMLGCHATFEDVRGTRSGASIHLTRSVLTSSGERPLQVASKLATQ